MYSIFNNCPEGPCKSNRVLAGCSFCLFKISLLVPLTVIKLKMTNAAIILVCSLCHRQNQLPVNTVCELAPKSLFWTPYKKKKNHEIPEVPFNQSGYNQANQTMTLCKGQSHLYLDSGLCCWGSRTRTWVLICRVCIYRRLIPSVAQANLSGATKNYYWKHEK